MKFNSLPIIPGAIEINLFVTRDEIKYQRNINYFFDSSSIKHTRKLTISYNLILIMKKVTLPLLKISLGIIGGLCSTSGITHAQVIPDGSVNTQVNQNGNISEIIGGETRGSNLFHSFQEFSVGISNEAFFNNANAIENIFSRVTGGNISNIDGLLSANGTANLFLLNPAGIIFGQNARLDINGSFIATSADSIQFSDGTFFSATDTQTQPILTINAPIGLNFRDNPGDIVNQSFFSDDTGLVGLRVLADNTLALIGGNVLIDGGFLTSPGGRIELGSVADNSVVNLTSIEKGFDISYEDGTNFQDINLSFAAFVSTFDANPGDIEVQGRNISLIEGSQLGINAQFEGQAGNVNVIASESLTIDGNAIEVDLGGFESLIFSNIFDEATGEGSTINVDTSELTVTNGGRIASVNNSVGKGANVNINASEIILGQPFAEGSFLSSILAQVGIDVIGDGGDLKITTKTLTANEGAQITTDTFGAGNGGNLTINASESIKINGILADSEFSTALFSNVGQNINATGNAGNLTIDTPRLEVRDGAQIGTTAQNSGNGGILTINASESILLSGTSSLAEFRGTGRSGIFVNAEPILRDLDTGEPILDESGNPFVTTGNGGTLNLTTGQLIIEKGAIISANNFGIGQGGNITINVNNLIIRNGGEIGAGSVLGVDPIDNQRGAGGTLTINDADSIQVTGTGEINGTPLNSSIFTLSEGTGNAGSLNINTNKLTVSDSGDINSSSIGTGAAGNLTINAGSIDLDQGTLTATTTAGTGGNITLNIQGNITLRNNSLISAEATETANGGNVTIGSPEASAQFIIAYPSQGDGSDILASAGQGNGGLITINAESLLNIEEREALANNGTNDLDATSDSGVDGTVTINNPDTNHLQGEIQLSSNVIRSEETVAQACQIDRTIEQTSGLAIKGKGGVPATPTNPFDSEVILVDETITPRDRQATYPEIKPISTNIGDIYPARGIVKTEDGNIILTAYATDNLNPRTPHISANCTSLVKQ